MPTDNANRAATVLLRQAIAAGDFRRASQLWNTYADDLRQEISRRRCTRTRLAEAAELLAWARRTTLCLRSQAQQQLNAIHAAARYSAGETRTPSLLRTTL